MAQPTTAGGSEITRGRSLTSSPDAAAASQGSAAKRCAEARHGYFIWMPRSASATAAMRGPTSARSRDRALGATPFTAEAASWGGVRNQRDRVGVEMNDVGAGRCRGVGQCEKLASEVTQTGRVTRILRPIRRRPRRLPSPLLRRAQRSPPGNTRREQAVRCRPRLYSA
jgi:hypothetical protein